MTGTGTGTGGKIMRHDCTPDAEIPVRIPSKRKYTGPAKGSEEAKARMAKVREAQWRKNGLIPNAGANAPVDPSPTSRY